jgi:hypothetical protein
MNNTKKILSALGIAAIMAAPINVHALGIPFNLGSAGGWAILELGNGTVGGDTHINNPSPPAVADGNVGIVGYVGGGGTFNSSGPDVTGGLFLGTGASAQLSGGAQVLGGITQDYGPLTDSTAASPPFAPVYQDALNAYNTAKALVPNQTFATVSGPQSFTPGVYSIGTLDVHGQNITLNGTAADWFIFNITTKFNMQDAAEIVLAGGITPDHVMWNLNAGVDVSTSGGLNQETILRGILLGLEGSKVNLSPGALFGEIAVSGDISLASGASVVNQVPDAGSTFALMAIGLGLLAAAKRKFLS